jgi:hypothetical protein
MALPTWFDADACRKWISDGGMKYLLDDDATGDVDSGEELVDFAVNFILDTEIKPVLFKWISAANVTAIQSNGWLFGVTLSLTVEWLFGRRGLDVPASALAQANNARSKLKWAMAGNSIPGLESLYANQIAADSEQITFGRPLVANPD